MHGKPETFRSALGREIFHRKYAISQSDTWEQLVHRCVDDVVGTMGGTKSPLMSKSDREVLEHEVIVPMKFIPGGRYLYYAGRPLHAFNNCFVLKSEEDTREDWARLAHNAMSCLAMGGGIGNDYSVYRPNGRLLQRTGGKASGPIPLMQAINEIGRNVMQGGSRRSAMYASLDRTHDDIWDFLHAKDWNTKMVPGTELSFSDMKLRDFNWAAPLDMTNISVNYKTDWLERKERWNDSIFLENCKQALKSGEPGFSFNFYDQEDETGRNAPVSADTWVMTHTGYRRVRDIVGQETTLWTGKQWSSATFVCTKQDTPVVEVKMTGGRAIKADPTHEFLVERYQGKGVRRRLTHIERVSAGNLQAGDALHTSLPSQSCITLNPTAYTLGFVYGDGSFNDKGIDVTLCTPEKKALLQYFDASKISSVTESDQRGYTRVYMTRFATGQKDTYPDLDYRAKSSFIAGLFDADGSYDSKHARIRLGCVHRNFLEGVRRDLEFLGIQSSINVGSKSGYTGGPNYTLIINAEFNLVFEAEIPTRRVRPQPHIAYRKSAIKVLSVTPAGNEDVYCCDVGVAEHSFCAEGVIISNCTEVTSADDSDCCNLGSINLSRIDSIDELRTVTRLAAQFLVAGTLRADLPYEKVRLVREKNRRLGLGLMGLHEWLLARGERYEVTDELHHWLGAWREESITAADEHCDRFFINRPIAYRSIAPTGTLGLIAGTTTGIEPLYAVAYKRRYLVDGTRWHYQYAVDSTAETLIERGIAPDTIVDTASGLANDVERRIKFQFDIQKYVDQAISSTINLPQWGSETNNESTVAAFAKTLADYAPGLRGFTVYPDGSRGGQPLTSVPYDEAIKHVGTIFEENEDAGCRSGICGI